MLLIGGCYDTVKRNLNDFPSRLPIALMEQQFSGANKNLLLLSEEKINKKFSLPMPPPNITGKLHLGHALNINIQDALMRWHAQRSSATRWLPGIDHAGIATHEKILEKLPHLKNKIFNLNDCEANSPEYSEYMSTANEWKESHQGQIFRQFKSLQPHCNLDNPRFTMDGAYQALAKKALLLFKDNLYWESGELFLNLKESRIALILALTKGEIECQPAGHKQRLIAMLKEDRPWNIGRSIPWGLPIPKWCYELPGANIGQITIDTWFNSSLWPSAMHSEEPTPFDALITGYDISFFWAARMCMTHHALYGAWPFKRIYLHGLIRDENGLKFSKSLGNGIDPIEIIETDGADALRIWCLENSAWGRDFKCKRAEISKGNALPTKFLNATRWLLMNRPQKSNQKITKTTPARIGGNLTNWSFDSIDKQTSIYMENCAPDAAWKYLRQNAWDNWCSGWLMKNKETISNDEQSWIAAMQLHKQWLIRLHPFMPITSWWIFQQIDNL